MDVAVGRHCAAADERAFRLSRGVGRLHPDIVRWLLHCRDAKPATVRVESNRGPPVEHGLRVVKLLAAKHGPLRQP
eukprot:3142206-Prymnesium_polylepis.1